MSENNGGPAFPGNPSKDVFTNLGMSLRDYFAAKAMQGLLAAPDCSACPQSRLADVEAWRAEIRSQNAAYCYDMADAMLKERGQ